MKFYDFAVPARVARITTSEEAINLINVWNGVTNIYLSLNPYEIISTDEFDNTITKTHVTRIFFDIDNNDIISVQKLIDYLLKEDLKFQLYHSGGGYHIYIHVKENNCPRNMRIAQLSILYESQATVDMSSVGDLMRITRIPNSWNFKASAYCIPIKIDELDKRGTEQRFETFIYGSKELDLTKYTETNFESIKPRVINNMQLNTNIPLIPCIKNIIKKINPTQVERYCLVMFLSYTIRGGRDLREFDMHLISEQIIKFFEENCYHWLDWDIRTTTYQIENILPKSNIQCRCKFLKSKGVCIECIKIGL